jgi:FkbM family methyltransferase
MSSVSRRALACVANHTFLVRPLLAGGAIIDAGANVGLFCSQMAERYRLKALAIEPHPAHFGRVAAGQLISKVQAAVAPVDGPLTLRLDDNWEGSRVDASAGAGVTVAGRTLESLAEEFRLDRLALVKLDIEGAELDVLDGMTDGFLDRVAQFTVEFHDFAGYATTARVEQTLRRLEGKGFAAVKFSRRYYGDTLIAHTGRCGLSASDVWWLRNIARNWRGVKRWVGRRVGLSAE